MVGGGTSYAVYVQTKYKGYHPLSYGWYASTYHDDGRSYFNVSDFLRTRDIDALPRMTDERTNAFRNLERLAERIGFLCCCKAFPEIHKFGKIPFLWTSETHEPRRVDIRFKLNDRNVERLAVV